MARDDDEDDLCEDSKQLFSHSIQAPIAIDSDDQEGRSGNQKEGKEGDNTKPSRPSTSLVWLDFKKLYKIVKVRSLDMQLGASIALSNILLSLQWWHWSAYLAQG